MSTLKERRAVLKEAKRKSKSKESAPMDYSIWERILFPKVAAIFDLDGVLVDQRQVRVSQDLQVLLRGTPMLKFVASGRTLGSCWEVGYQISAKGVFAENAAFYQFFGEQAKSAVHKSDIERFKRGIRFEMEESPYARITVEGKCSRVLFEPGKKEILTLGTSSMREQGLVHELADCRWSSGELRELTEEFVKREGLRISVVGPYSDGNIDYQPTDENGVPYDKGISPDIVKAKFPWVRKIIVAVDGPNDIRLASHPDVFPISFENGCDTTKKAVLQNGGKIFDGKGFEGGCLQAVQFIREEILGLGPVHARSSQR